MALLADLTGVVFDDAYRHGLIANREVGVVVLLVGNFHNRVGEAADVGVILEAENLLKLTVNFWPRIHD